MSNTIKLIAGKVKIPVTITETNGRLFFQFPFNRPLMAEIKVMEGARYHGFDDVNPRKVWSVSDSQRNRFQLAYLKGENPYAPYDKSLIDFKSSRPLYSHQSILTRAGLTFHYCIWSAEMGVGKTLSAIELMEASGCPDWFWVGTRGSLAAAQLEFQKWKCKIKPIIMTYEGLRKIMEGWQSEILPPHGVIFDESSRLKNQTAKRTQAAQYLANNIRDTWGGRGFVIEMSGSPAPKSPVDWWSQCEIACPGYIREGRVDKFKERLALIRLEQTSIGQSFPKLITWWDDEKKCGVCGLYENDPCHDLENMAGEGFHGFQKSINEVSYLYKRMKGLVTVFFKKDCLELPDKQYKMIFCPPTQSTLNAMKLITASAKTTIQGLTLLRELSDGFQYVEVKTGTEVCPLCDGNKTREDQTYIGPDYTEDELLRVGVSQSSEHPDNSKHSEFWKLEIQACAHCKGNGFVDSYSREVKMVDCPKEQVLADLLEDHEDTGRLVVYAGFTGSVDRCVQIAKKNGWRYIRVDGRGWHSDLPDSQSKDDTDFLSLFQRVEECDEKVVFIGQPGAAGMGITLTASPTIVYYSNDFNAESRIQSEDRIHRPGMDTNKGATIIDLVHLPSDKLVIDNLQKKRDLQSLTLGQMKIELDKVGEERVV